MKMNKISLITLLFSSFFTSIHAQNNEKILADTVTFISNEIKKLSFIFRVKHFFLFPCRKTVAKPQGKESLHPFIGKIFLLRHENEDDALLFSNRDNGTREEEEGMTAEAATLGDGPNMQSL